MGNITVTMEAMSVEGKSLCPVETSFWEDLWDQYTADFQEVVVHCWKEEQEAIDELSPRAINVINEGLMKVITVNLSDENRLFFRNYSVDPRGGLKWFTMFFQVDGEEGLEIGNYGSEIILYNMNEEEKERFISIFSTSAITHYYDEYAD